MPSGRECAVGNARLALVHDSRRFDGHYSTFRWLRRALEPSAWSPEVYTCVDPSLADEYPEDGTRLLGWRWPFGGYGERGLNRALPIFSRQLRRLPAQLVHVWDVYLLSLVRYRSEVVVTVADLAKRNTRYYPAAASWLHNRALRYLPRARAIVCHSEWVRGDIIDTVGVDPDRIHVVRTGSSLPPTSGPRAPPVEPPSARSPWNCLYVAADRPHKNLRFFLEILRAAGPAFRGTLVTWPTPATRAEVHRMGLDSRVEFITGRPDLSGVYAAADLFLFPSRYEGFGVPLVEAMSQGVPVIASDRTSVPEVVGPAAPTLSVDDVGPWVREMEQLSNTDRYRRSALASWNRAREFTPEKTLREVVPAYELALARP